MNNQNKKISLPSDFINLMSDILGEQLDAYLDSFTQESSKAIHLNTSKLTNEEFCNYFSDSFKKLEYTENGYTTNLSNIGILPLHHAGIIYSQDPGAMMPVSAIPYEFTKDDVVLDLCAAPGGKSSQLANILSKCNAVLVSNEINSSRNQILQSNMERMGYTNVTITKMSPDQIASAFPGTFSFILIDAPCSGEGMFRKYPESIDEWSLANVKMCSDRQKEIIDQAVNALRPGGYILYSTCTYSLEENEEIIEYMVNNYDFEVVELKDNINDFSVPLHNDNTNPGRHFFPHIAYGEGQYLCLLKSKANYTGLGYVPKHNLKPVNKPTLKLIEDALKGNDNILSMKFYEYGKNIIIIPNENAPFYSKGITAFGIKAGTIEKNRFIPHHHLYKTLGQLFNNKLDLTDQPNLLNNYLKGLELTIEDQIIPNGYGVITYLNIPIGGYKASNNRLKNHYPKGLRNLKDYI